MEELARTLATIALIGIIVGLWFFWDKILDLPRRCVSSMVTKRNMERLRDHCNSPIVIRWVLNRLHGEKFFEFLKFIETERAPAFQEVARRLDTASKSTNASFDFWERYYGTLRLSSLSGSYDGMSVAWPQVCCSCGRPLSGTGYRLTASGSLDNGASLQIKRIALPCCPEWSCRTQNLPESVDARPEPTINVDYNELRLLHKDFIAAVRAFESAS